METPWGSLAVSDAHVHLLSHGFFEALSRQKGVPVASDLALLGIEAPPEEPVALADRWVAELDRQNVESAVLIASVPGDEGSVEQAIRAHPTRFFGYFMLDPTQPDAVSRATAAIANGLQGLCLFPAMHRYSIGGDAVLDVLEAVAHQPGAVVFVHCGVLSVGIRGKLGLPSHFDMRFSNPIDLHAVALRFPKATFVLPHLGAGYLREALMLADLCPNVYLDTSSTNSWTRYQVPPISLADAFRSALEVLGPKRLLFGTDSSFFPRGWVKAVFDTQTRIFHELGVTSEDAALIFGGNLRRILDKR